MVFFLCNLSPITGNVDNPKLKGIFSALQKAHLVWKSFLFQTDQDKTVGSSTPLKGLKTKPAKVRRVFPER